LSPSRRISPEKNEEREREKEKERNVEKKKKKSHPAANNGSGIMIRATIHRIVLPTSCRGIVSRVFGCHPSAAKWPDTFSPPPTPAPASWRADVPVFRVSRLFIIIIAIADLMSNASAPGGIFLLSPGVARAMFFHGASWCAPGDAFLLAGVLRDFDFLTKSIHGHIISRYGVNHIGN